MLIILIAVPTMPMDIPGLKDADALKNRDPSWIEPSMSFHLFKQTYCLIVRCP